jgi:hypothetical protein
VGNQNGEDRPRDRLASRDGKCDECKHADEQQAVRIGTTTQLLQVARIETSGRDSMVEVKSDAAEEGEQRQADPTRAVPDKRQDDDYAKGAVREQLPERG